MQNDQTFRKSTLDLDQRSIAYLEMRNGLLLLSVTSETSKFGWDRIYGEPNVSFLRGSLLVLIVSADAPYIRCKHSNLSAVHL